MAVAEANAALGITLDGVAALVDEAMVLITEKHEVLEARLAAVRPVLAVVGLQMAAALAAGEAAGVVVACLEEPAERGWHRAAAAADADREAVALDLRHDLGVAAEPAGRLGRDQRAVLELGAAAAVGGERGGVDVDDDARPLPVEARPLPRIDASARSSSASTRAGRGGSTEAPSAIRLRLVGVVRRCGALLAATLEHPLPRRLERLDQQRAVLGREPCPEKKGAVVVEVVVDVLELVRFAGVLRRNPAERPKRPLQLRCRQRRPRARAGSPRTTPSRPSSAPVPW